LISDAMADASNITIPPRAGRCPQLCGRRSHRLQPALKRSTSQAGTHQRLSRSRISSHVRSADRIKRGRSMSIWSATPFKTSTDRRPDRRGTGVTHEGRRHRDSGSRRGRQAYRPRTSAGCSAGFPGRLFGQARPPGESSTGALVSVIVKQHYRQHGGHLTGRNSARTRDRGSTFLTVNCPATRRVMTQSQHIIHRRRRGEGKESEGSRTINKRLKRVCAVTA